MNTKTICKDVPVTLGALNLGGNMKIKLAFIGIVAILAATNLSACAQVQSPGQTKSSGVDVTKPAPERSLSANPKYPASCELASLVAKYPNLQYDVYDDESSTSPADGTNGKPLGCISGDPNGDVLTMTKFSYTKISDDFKSWKKLYIDAQMAYKFKSTSMAGCTVYYSEYQPNSDSPEIYLESDSYCNGVSVHMWTPGTWESAHPVLLNVLDALI
jgi:hypothetical protein